MASADGAIIRRTGFSSSSFTVTHITAGASDAICRIALIYNILTTYSDLSFDLPTYSNYHCRELDFFELFDVNRAYGNRPLPAPEKTVEIRFSEIVDAIENGEEFLEANVHYLVRADLYEVSERINRFRKKFHFEKTFFQALSYTPATSYFEDDPASVKVTIHLRRQDICGSALFSGRLGEIIPDEEKQKVHSRPLLQIDRAIKELEGHLSEGTVVQAVVTSDGVDELRKRYGHYEGAVDRLNELHEELLLSPTSGRLKILYRGRIIGNGPQETLQALDAMSRSDIVVTASSSFPRLSCEVSGASQINIRLNN